MQYFSGTRGTIFGHSCYLSLPIFCPLSALSFKIGWSELYKALVMPVHREITKCYIDVF